MQGRIIRGDASSRAAAGVIRLAYAGEVVLESANPDNGAGITVIFDVFLHLDVADGEEWR